MIGCRRVGNRKSQVSPPDKMPITLSPEQIKGMSKADWYELGMELQIAGYDVFKNR